MQPLVRPLLDGPLDLVGDVHGELAALVELVGRLGYGPEGVHPRGRRLVFLGDLTDRGPDSPGVVDFVRRLVDAQRAQCVLGNHDLNLLLGLRKHDNGWFHGEEFRTRDGRLLPQRLADDDTRRSALEFFRSLPIALERPGLRVVHAYWDAGMIALARAAASAAALEEEHRARIEANHRERREADAIVRELEHQNLNPMKLLTSGPEQPAARPRESGGRLRRLERMRWWPLYDEPESFVFGHYGLPCGAERSGPSAFCVDYAVGKRSLERLAGGPPFASKLAALRWPEGQVLFDDGLSESCGLSKTWARCASRDA